MSPAALSAAGHKRVVRKPVPQKSWFFGITFLIWSNGTASDWPGSPVPTRMPKPPPKPLPNPRRTLFDEAAAGLPLFDDLPDGAVERLAAGGFGRGLLTASLRARLRKAGFADMAMLALASPADLTAVRKIGPLRVEAIRAHLLGELGRLLPGARAFHDGDATDRRRRDRLRAVPVADLPLDAALRESLGRAGATAADLAAWRRIECGPDRGLTGADLDRIVAALTLALRPDGPPRAVPAAADETVPADRAERDRAALLRERDREWDEAAPAERDRGA